MTGDTVDAGRALDESVRDAVRQAVALGPQVTLEHDWQLEEHQGDWWLVAAADAALLPQAQVLAAGAAAQEVLLAMESSSHRVAVTAFPSEEPRAVAVVRVIGSGPSRRAAALLEATHRLRIGGAGFADELPMRALLPSDRVHLDLAAEAFACELLWQDDVAGARPRAPAQRVAAGKVSRPLTTVVTRTDDRRDWFAAGRAVTACLHIACDLRLPVQLGPHALGQLRTRTEVRTAWSLEGWPQAQLTLITQDPEV